MLGESMDLNLVCKCCVTVREMGGKGREGRGGEREREGEGAIRN